MHALNIVAIWASLQAIVCAAPGFGQIQPQAEYDVDYCKGSDYEGCRRIEGPYDQCSMKMSYRTFFVFGNIDLFYVVNLRDIAPDYNNEISSLIVYGQGSCMTWV